jgi:uncharacterized protein YbcI
MNPNQKTKGELEAEFTKKILNFEKEYLGRGPVQARTYLINDMVLVRLQGVLTNAEEKLAQNKEGQALVKETRRHLFETSRSILSGFVKEILGTDMVDFYSDISTESGERIIVITVARDFGH